MENVVLNIFIGVLSELIILFIITALHNVEKNYIIELGYRSKDKKYKPRNEKLPIWNNLLYWDLCKNAKLKTRAIWAYFASNLVLLVLGITSVILCIFLILTCEPLSVLLYQLGYVEFLCLFWAIPHFILDLIFIPSVRKRYGINKKR